MSNRLLAFAPAQPCRQPAVLSFLALFAFAGIAMLPIVLMLVQSFIVDGALSFNRYATLFSDDRILSILTRSIAMACGSVFFSLLFGIPLAVWLVRASFAGKKAAVLLYLVPLFIPPHIHALAWSYLLGEKGLLPSLILQNGPGINIYCPVGVAAILFLAYFPLLVLTLTTGFAEQDARLEEAARFHAPPLKVWRKIILPLVGPYIFAGAVFVFIFSFFNYGVPSVLRVLSFPVEIFTRFSAFYDEAGATALSAPLVLVVVLLLLAQRIIMADRSYLSIGGASRAVMNSSPAKSLPAAVFVWLFLGTAIVLPLAALIFQAGSLKSMQMAWRTSTGEMVTSIFVSCGAATLATLLAYLLATFLAELSAWRRSTVNLFLLLPFAFPAVLFGIGLIHLWNRPGTRFVYGGLAILVLAYTACFIPYAIQIIAANLSQIAPAMKEAACICEGSRLRRAFRIELPLARRGLVICWMMVFIFSMGELGATLLVIPPGEGTVSLKIYTLMHYGAGPLVAALAIILIAVNLLVSGLLAGVLPK
jgi:iron(III) transport system permease protein